MYSCNSFSFLFIWVSTWSWQCQVAYSCSWGRWLHCVSNMKQSSDQTWVLLLKHSSLSLIRKRPLQQLHQWYELKACSEDCIYLFLFRFDSFLFRLVLFTHSLCDNNYRIQSLRVVCWSLLMLNVFVKLFSWVAYYYSYFIMTWTTFIFSILFKNFCLNKTLYWVGSCFFKENCNQILHTNVTLCS